MNNRRLVPMIIIGVILLFVVMALSSSLFYTIATSERAIIFYKFGEGLDKETVIGEGFHTKAPWNDVFVYSINETSSDENMDVLDKNGLSIHVDVSARYNPMPDKIGYIHQKFYRTSTDDYIRVLVIPEVRSTVRQVMGRYTAEEIYSTKRAEVEGAIKTETEKILQLNYVNATAVLIRSIVLPEQIKGAIENKLQQEQEALAYQFRLDKEKSEAERKRIAAEGEARANNIVNSSLSDKLLKMRGIEATLELSKSPNSKVVIVGSSKDGLPLILGNN
ncbi:prohibitin family protein [Pseudochryseolinea flava]|uniref:Prohibitin family protein n=1 Tax=Pseudochryseolinea flava TaxID=2059302 RepID=A0A364XYS6_9BACT|nr:prohibitin family protein [Pseudochryseolinea flava]RAV99611.1 prohibitin family protein [Pseudochryseolinea flava]